jgi:prolipoprotein diacylglyceryltransferase
MEGLQLNKKKMIAIMVIVAVSIAGTVVFYALFANENVPFMGTMVFQSNVAGVTVTMLGPDEMFKTGLVGENGELTFAGLPEGDYEAIYTKDGYTTGRVGNSINRGVMGGRKTVVINMEAFPVHLPLYASTNPSAVIIKQGSSKTVTVTVTSLVDFVGEGSLDCMQLPSGVTVAFSPANVTLTAGGKASSTLTLMVNSTAAKGIYPVDVVYSTEQHINIWLALLLQVS